MKCWHGHYCGIGCPYCEGTLKDERGEYEATIEKRNSELRDANVRLNAELHKVRSLADAMAPQLKQVIDMLEQAFMSDDMLWTDMGCPRLDKAKDAYNAWCDLAADTKVAG